ncbi:MAG TPA: hypothetical protein VGV67_10535 [Solirubrobacteraceae bacterium]|nr:hypothetical protein [Solirubrobacteraceae bacterium]
MSRSLARTAVALLLIVAFAATSCERDPADPSARLAAAAEATAADSFTWALTIDADPAALRSLGEAAQAAAALESLEIRGARSGDGASVSVAIVGLEALELRRVDAEHLFLRVAVPDLAGLTGAEIDVDRVVTRLRRQGLSPAVVETVASALRGRWVGVVGRIDADELRRAAGGRAPGRRPEVTSRDALGGDLTGFIARYLTVAAPTSEDGEQVYDVALHVRELLEAVLTLDPRNRRGDLAADLRRVPRKVPATVRTAAGTVRAVSVDIAEFARRGGGDLEGSIRLALAFADHGEAPPVRAPGEASTVTAEQLLEAVRTVAATADEPSRPRASRSPA